MFAPYDERYHAPDGEYVGMYVHPRPLQQPHPPVWLMSNTPGTFEMAGSQGMGVVGMNTAKDNLRACWSAYQKGSSEGQNLTLRPGEGVGMCVVIYVAETMEEAAREIRPSINHYYEFVTGARPANEWGRQSLLNKGQVFTTDDQQADWFDFLQYHDIIWIGTADYVAEKDRTVSRRGWPRAHHAAATVSWHSHRENSRQHDPLR